MAFGEVPRGGAHRKTGRQSIHDGYIEFIDHEDFGRESREVLSLNISGEARCMFVTKPHGITVPNDVSPQYDALPRDVSPQNVETLVPVIELLIIRRLKARSA